MQPSARRWAPLALLAAALVLLPPAQAAYGAGSTLEAEAPILLAGRADALVAQGVASLVSSDASAPLSLALEAAELHVLHRDVYRCAPTGFLPSCPAPPMRGTDAREWSLTDARVTLTRVLTAYKVAVTNSDDHADSSSFGAPGTLMAAAGANAVLAANPRDHHLSPYAPDWTSSDPGAASEPVYTVPALEGTVGALGGSLRATGGFETLLQGVEVRVEGTDANGEPFAQTFSLPAPDDEHDAVKYLVLEAAEGDLLATGGAPLVAYGVSVVDVRGSATFQAATGKVVEDGRERAYDGDDLTLAGPLSLTLTRVAGGDDQAIRLTVAVSSALRVLDAVPPRDEPREPTELLAAGAAGAAGASLLAALAYFWPRLKFASTALLLPMYTRIERQAVLEHEKRDEIYELIRASPGIHAHEIGERVQIGWGTTVYHLKLLEQHDLVVSKRSGRYKRFFVNTGEYTKKKDVYGALRNETAKRVADFIVNHPGCSQKELCAALGIQPSLASWHVEKLEGVELVKRVKDGRMVRYFAGPAWEMLNVRIDPAGGAAGVAET